MPSDLWLSIGVAAMLTAQPTAAERPWASSVDSLVPPAQAKVCNYSALHPRRYAAYYIDPSHAQISVDGLLNDTAWEQIAWSEPFVDIEGDRHWSQPWFATKIKMRFDDQSLYIAAYLEEQAVTATLTERNSVVFQDNDFEVFVDADGSTHNYKEFEVNALNTTWNLLLNRPYRDGGHENSTRVDREHGFDMFGKGMRSAVYVKGRVNDATQRLHYWTVEIALPLAELVRYTAATLPPSADDFWRINFSRVEWQSQTTDNGRRFVKIPGQREQNWVWSPQYAVNMHMPEQWGYLQFRYNAPTSKALEPNNVPLDPKWDVRYLAFQFYYAQRAFHDARGQYAVALDQLEPFFRDPSDLDCMSSLTWSVVPGIDFYHGMIVWQRQQTVYHARIQADGLISVYKP